MKLKKTNSSRDNIFFLREIEKKLLKARIPQALAEVESLVTQLGKINRLDFFTGQKSLSPAAKKKILKLLDKRIEGKPLSYLLKQADFYGKKIYVDAGTLIPRPETEILVEEALGILNRSGVKGPRVLDLGTGSGCIAISLTSQRPDCKMTALDISKKALSIARKNIKDNGLEKKISCLQGDLFSAFNKKHEAFWDMIVSNPPYIPENEMESLPKEVRCEPSVALDGGKKGLQIIFSILEKAPYFLKKNGWLLMEIGMGQHKAIEQKIKRLKFYKNSRFVKDFAGIDRVFIAQKS